MATPAPRDSSASADRRDDLEPSLRWHRYYTADNLAAAARQGVSPDYCDGYRDAAGRFEIQRHRVDDREYDGGECWTYWNLYFDGAAQNQHAYLKQAKAEAQRIAARFLPVAL